MKGANTLGKEEQGERRRMDVLALASHIKDRRPVEYYIHQSMTDGFKGLLRKFGAIQSAICNMVDGCRVENPQHTLFSYFSQCIALPIYLYIKIYM